MCIASLPCRCAGSADGAGKVLPTRRLEERAEGFRFRFRGLGLGFRETPPDTLGPRSRSLDYMSGRSLSNALAPKIPGSRGDPTHPKPLSLKPYIPNLKPQNPKPETFADLWLKFLCGFLVYACYR